MRFQILIVNEVYIIIMIMIKMAIVKFRSSVIIVIQRALVIICSETKEVLLQPATCGKWYEFDERRLCNMVR